MTPLEIELQSPRPLANILLARPMVQSNIYKDSNWLKIAISFITILCCFQANKIKVSYVSYCIFFSNDYFNKTVGMNKIASDWRATDSYFVFKVAKTI